MNIKSAMMITMMMAVAFPSFAGFLKLDWKATGDQKAVLQESTGVEWLKLTQTENMSINEVLAQTGAGGLYEGWRVAMSSEVDAMMNELYPTIDAGSDSDGQLRWTAAYSGGDYTPWDNIRLPFSNLFGWTYARDDRNFAYAMYKSYGIYLNDYEGRAQSYDVLLSGINFNRKQPGSSSRYHTYYANMYQDFEGGGVYTQDYKSADVGVFLVSDGGLTLSSINNPQLNINNPNAPVNEANDVVDVAEPSGIALVALSILGMAVRRRKK